MGAGETPASPTTPTRPPWPATFEALGAETGSYGPQQGNGTDPNPDGWLATVDWHAFWDEETAVNEWAVEPIVPAGRQVQCGPGPRSAKACSLSTSPRRSPPAPVLGQPGRSAIDVVYVDLEMTPGDLRERLEALGYGPPAT